MKNLSLFLIFLCGCFLLSGCFMISSCTKKKGEHAPSITAVVNGSYFSAPNCNSYFMADRTTLAIYSYVRTSTGPVAANPSIQLELSRFNGRPGVYPLALSGSSKALYVVGTDTTYAESGSVVITFVDTTGERNYEFGGTFEFHCKNGNEVKSGQFVSEPWFGLL